MSIFLGIDLGTSQSSVACVIDDPRYRTAAIIPVSVVELPTDDQAAHRSNRMPTVVSCQFDDRRQREPLIGWEFFRTFARRRRGAQLLRRGRHFVTSVKSDMGTFRVYPHAFSADLNTPVKISARIITTLMDEARGKFGADVRGARVVITVPASFSALARDDTLQAARLAGLSAERVDLIDEPVAALVDLLNDPQAAIMLSPDQMKHVLVFDYGGGTCDLALVRARFDPSAHTGLHVENVAISEYRRLGGDDIDRSIMASVVWPQIDDAEGLSPATRRAVEETLTPTVARGLKERLCRKVAEEIRRGVRNWSKADSRPCKVDETLDRTFEDARFPKRFEMVLDDFEQIMEPFLEVPTGSPEDMGTRHPHSLLVPVFQVLDKAGLDPAALDVLVLHGGGCRNPWVHRRFTEMRSLFPRVVVVQTPDLDASVAKGAALACYWKHGRGSQLIPPIVGEDLGVITQGNVPVLLVRAGTVVPYPDEGVAAAEAQFYVAHDDQTEILVPVYTMERARIGGSVKVALPPSVPQGAAVRIKLRVDADKRLHWWFSVREGPYEAVTPINDPWASRVLTPEQQRLMDHRRAMRERVERGAAVNRHEEYVEALLLYLAGDLDEALASVGDHLLDYGDTAPALNLKGLILGRLSRAHADAADCHRRASELDPTNAVYTGNYGCELYRQGHAERAIAVIREALGRDRGLAYLYEWLGDIYRHLADEAGAQREYRQGLMLTVTETERYPNFRDAWERRARLHHKLNEYGAADVATRTVDKLLQDGVYGGDSDNLVVTL